MTFDLFTIMYLFGNAFSAYTLFRIFRHFLKKSGRNRTIELISYAAYYIFNSYVYLAHNNALLTTITSILMFVLITINYQSTWKRRITVALITFAILGFIEALVAVVLSLIGVQFIMSEKMLIIYGILISRLLFYVFAVVISQRSTIERLFEVPAKYWLSVLFMSVGVAILSYILLNMDGISQLVTIISICTLFFICAYLLNFYDALIKIYNDNQVKANMQMQIASYQSQFDLITESQNNQRRLRHDMKNHLLSLDYMMQSEKYDAAQEYLSDLIGQSDAGKEYAKTGILELDSILNYKIVQAKRHNISIQLEAQVPDQLNVAPFDLIIVIGNLLDNAIEAVQDLDAERSIDVDIRLVRGFVNIRVRNPYQNDLIENNGIYTSTKSDTSNHGIGLGNVRTTADKYNGSLEIDTADHIFSADVFLYNVQPEAKKKGRKV